MTLEEALQAFVPVVMPRAYCGLSAMRNTATLTADVLERGVPGDLVECGVFAGVNSAIMAKGLMLAGTPYRRVWLFDSFQGIPHAGPRDNVWPGLGERPGMRKDGALVSTGVSVCSKAEVEQFMTVDWQIDPSLLVFVEGWFQHTLPALNRERILPEIALLRLDGDLYDSTMTCLEHLYPLLVQGGCCIVDDYNLLGCRDAVSDFFYGRIPPYQEIVRSGEAGIWWRK